MNQLINADRLNGFKKYEVERCGTERDAWPSHPHNAVNEGGVSAEGGFRPSPGAFSKEQSKYRNGLYLDNHQKSFASDFFRSSYF